MFKTAPFFFTTCAPVCGRRRQSLIARVSSSTIFTMQPVYNSLRSGSSILTTLYRLYVICLILFSSYISAASQQQPTTTDDDDLLNYYNDDQRFATEYNDNNNIDGDSSRFTASFIQIIDDVVANDRNFTVEEINMLSEIACNLNEECKYERMMHLAPAPEFDDEEFELAQERGRLNPRVGVRFGRGGPSAYVQGGIRGRCQEICQSTAVRYGGVTKQAICQRSACLGCGVCNCPKPPGVRIRRSSSC